jgi:hypothetical protein
VVWSRSANDTPAAITSMTTPLSAGGSSTWVHWTPAGPVKSTILWANIGSPSRRSPDPRTLSGRTAPRHRTGMIVANRGDVVSSPGPRLPAGRP